MQPTTPNDLLSAIGYVGESEKVGVLLSIHQGIFTAVVVEKSYTHHLNPAPLIAVMDAMGPAPFGAYLGGMPDAEATHWIVVDREKNEWSLLPAALARSVVTGEPITPDQVDEAQRLAELYD